MEKTRATTGECPVRIYAAGVMLDGDLCLPPGAQAVVLFAHGSGSSRLSRRNRFVAEELRKAGLGTLLFDLLTKEEERIDVHTAELRFDIGLLARRLMGATDWATSASEAKGHLIGYFGASTGAAAALAAAAERPEVVGAVVSRGGRPDLAGDALPHVKIPTLLIVGGRDTQVIDLNKQAMTRLPAEVKLEIVPGATHLFEEPGTLAKVARLATGWFANHLGSK